MCFMWMKKPDNNDIINKLGVGEEEIKSFIIDHKIGNPAEIIIKASEKAAYIVLSTHGTTSDMSKNHRKV